MIHLLVIAASAAVVAKAAASIVTFALADFHDEKRSKQEISALDSNVEPVNPNWFVMVLARADDDYQMLVRTYIDPILAGRARNQHLQELVGDKKRNLSIQEKRSNRRLGLGFVAFGLLVDVYFTGIQLLPMVVVIGIYNLWPWFKESYRLAFKENRFGIIHLICLYFAVMWIGGFFLIGVVGAIFSGLCQKIQMITQIGAREDLIDVLGQKPLHVWIEVNGVEVEIPFEQLQLGDTLILDVGQMIPVDGMILDGWALVDQQRLTGESQPVEKSSGDTVLAATVVLGGKLRVCVEKSGDDTTAAKIADVLNRTVEYGVDNLRSEFDSVEHTVWPMLAGGMFGLLVGGPVTGAAILGCNYVVGIIPLRMITLLNALSAGSEHGILIKDGRVLESLKEIDTLVFDKTGTLTLEQPHIIGIHACGEYNENDVLRFAATAEHRQTHPIAQAILAEANERKLALPVIDAAHYEVGYGLKVKIEKAEILVGSQRFMTLEKVTLPKEIESHINRCAMEGRSLVYVAVDQKLAGVIELDATLRPEALEITRWLKERGLDLYIISGDQEAPTRRMSNELRMDGYFANVLPERKASLIEELQAEGRKVCFIGDGINDAVALRRANVSISFRGATNVATDSAHVVLMDDNLEQLKTLFELTEAYEKNLGWNYRQAVIKSLLASVAVLMLPLKFVIVEGVWIVTFISGIRIATQPLLSREENDLEAPIVEDNTGSIIRTYFLDKKI
ncbi:MAG: heavy metal translocating P-type ATPase [Methylococcaceae bacterium]